jgi:hypothetical protein
VQSSAIENMKREKKYKHYDKKDYGYLVTFEHENETQILLFKKGLHLLVADILGDSNMNFPYFLPFDTLDDYCKGKLKDKLYSFQSIGNDLLTLKTLILNVSIKRTENINHYSLTS